MERQLDSSAIPMGVRHEVGITRRRFFFFGAAAGISLVAAPVLKLLPPVAEAVDWPTHSIVIPARYISARIRISREAIEDSRYLRGGFGRVVAEEARRCDAYLQEQNQLAGLLGRRLQVFPLTNERASSTLSRMGLQDEERSIDAADFQREYQGSFETPQRADVMPVLRERRRPGDWTGPGRRADDPLELDRFLDDGGPA